MKKHVVFVHGWASSPYVWYYQVDFFKDKSQVWTPELIGYGKKALSSTNNLFDCMVDDICSFISEKKLDDICLAGWSLGGMVSLEVAKRLDKRLSSLVLMGTTAKFIQTQNFEWAISEQTISRIADRLSRNFTDTLNWFYRFMFTSKERSGKNFSKILHMLGDCIVPLDHKAVTASLKMLIKLDLRHLLKDITAPTLIIHGDKDPICPPEAAKFLQENIQNSHLELLEDCGHAPFLTYPNRVNESIGEFIT